MAASFKDAVEQILRFEDTFKEKIYFC